MNSVTNDYDIARPYERSYDRLDGRSKSALESELQGWGKYWEEKSEFQGFASASAITAFLDGMGCGIAAHRILPKEMPNSVYWTHQRYLQLSDNEREVLWNNYVAAFNPEIGRCPTPPEKAWLLGLSYGNYRVRLTRARFNMLGIHDPKDHV